MKKMLTLALGFSLAVSGANADVISKDDAVNLRKTAAVVSTVCSLDQVFFGCSPGNLRENEVINDANRVATHVYCLLASATEDGEFIMKVTSILQKVAAAKKDGLAGDWHTNAIKDLCFSVLKQTLVEAAHEAIDRAHAKFNVGLLNGNEYARRAARTVAYALSDGLIYFAMTCGENACYKKESSALEVGIETFLQSAFLNAFYEVGGHLVKRVIKADPATA